MSLQAALALQISIKVVACSVALGALEGLWLWSRGHFRPEGLWSWRTLGEAYPPRLAELVAPIMSHESMFVVLALRVLCAGLVVLVPYPEPMFGFALAALVLVHFFMNLRAKWGGEGSDNMTIIVLGAGLLGTLFAHDARAVAIAALFIGAQVTMSYLASGLHKLRSPHWRDGGALGKIMNHYTYGHPAFGGLLRRYPALGGALSFMVMAFQISFVLFYFIPMPYALVYPLGGVLFHAAIGYCMRLNQFFIVFVGTYPCLLFAHQYVRELLAS